MFYFLFTVVTQMQGFLQLTSMQQEVCRVVICMSRERLRQEKVREGSAMALVRPDRSTVVTAGRCPSHAPVLTEIALWYSSLADLHVSELYASL